MYCQAWKNMFEQVTIGFGLLHIGYIKCWLTFSQLIKERSEAKKTPPPPPKNYFQHNRLIDF